MDDWNTRQHAESGLMDRVLASTVTHAEAERRTLAFLAAWVDEGKSPMAGNSICQDRRFLAREMPMLERFFHYRNLDVTALKILAQQLGAGHCRRICKGSRTQGARRYPGLDRRAAWYRDKLLDADVLART